RRPRPPGTRRLLRPRQLRRPGPRRGLPHLHGLPGAVRAVPVPAAVPAVKPADRVAAELGYRLSFKAMTVSLESLTEHLELADALLAGRARMFEPQDLPGRYGRVIRAVDHVLRAVGCEAVLGGDWAVWRHGFHGRVTQDVDIVLAA